MEHLSVYICVIYRNHLVVECNVGECSAFKGRVVKYRDIKIRNVKVKHVKVRDGECSIIFSNVGERGTAEYSVG